MVGFGQTVMEKVGRTTRVPRDGGRRREEKGQESVVAYSKWRRNAASEYTHPIRLKTMPTTVELLEQQITF